MRMNGLLSIVRNTSVEGETHAYRSAVVDFYNHINLLYGSITEFCSPQSCPEMKATDEYAGPPTCTKV